MSMLINCTFLTHSHHFDHSYNVNERSLYKNRKKHFLSIKGLLDLRRSYLTEDYTFLIIICLQYLIEQVYREDFVIFH